MSQSTSDTERLAVEDLRLKSTEGGPVLEIGDEMSVLLRTFPDTTGIEVVRPWIRPTVPVGVVQDADAVSHDGLG